MDYPNTSLDSVAGCRHPQHHPMTAARSWERVVPRGIRNNNPLNIRIGNVWLGEVDNPTDPNFEQFVSMEYGLRAAFVLLRRYIRHYKRQTITDIITAWAPASENHTQKYIDTVSSLMGTSPDAPLLYEDVDAMTRLVDAMVYVECGQHVPMDKIMKGYSLA